VNPLFIALFVCVALSCVLAIAWIHAFDVIDGRKPSRRQLRQWKRERLALPRASVNRRRS
jgi:hypothetical protein